MLDERLQGLTPALAPDYARTLSRLRDLTLLIKESSPNLLKSVAEEMLRIERDASRGRPMAPRRHDQSG